jgi:hypothetical protein
MKWSPRVNRRTRNSTAIGLLALFTAAGVYSHAKAETAVNIASTTGDIIGAAEACGVGAGDLLSVGYVVIGWAREQAHSKAEVRRAQAAHEAAVTRAAARIRNEGPRACPAATAAFRDLQAKAQTPPGA